MYTTELSTTYGIKNHCMYTTELSATNDIKNSHYIYNRTQISVPYSIHSMSTTDLSAINGIK